MWALRKVARTYLNIPHGRDRGYFGAGLGAEDAVYFTYTRTKVTTPCARNSPVPKGCGPKPLAHDGAVPARVARRCDPGASDARRAYARALTRLRGRIPASGALLRAAARRLRCCPPCQASRLGCVGTPSIHPVLATTRLMRDIEIGSSSRREPQPYGRR